MAYPDELLKGIPNPEFIGEDGIPTSDLFYFKEEQTARDRKDDFWESSIYWRDDHNALSMLLNQKKDNDALQFKAGAAVLSRNDIDSLIRKPILKEKLNYERKEIAGNKYHGNLLLKNNVPKALMKKIAASISLLCVTSIEPNTRNANSKVD
jgi:hypothetical protein